MRIHSKPVNAFGTGATDLKVWDASETFIQRLTEIPTPEGTTIVTARIIGLNTSPCAFIRLAIDL